MRTIKKYPNRRLYDMHASAYVTLSDIKQLVLDKEELQVIDTKSGKDLTRSILLQVILEEEACGAPMFTTEMLSQMIRFYGSAMQGMMGQYLENNLRTFTDLQVELGKQARTFYGDNKSMNRELWKRFTDFQSAAMQNMMQTYADQSRSVFAKIQSNMQEQSRSFLTGFPFAQNPDDDGNR